MSNIFQIIHITDQFEAPNRRNIEEPKVILTFNPLFFSTVYESWRHFCVRRPLKFSESTKSKSKTTKQDYLLKKYARIKFLTVNIVKCYVLKFAPICFLLCMAAAIPFAIKAVLQKIDTVVSLTEKAYRWRIYLLYCSRIECVGPIFAPPLLMFSCRTNVWLTTVVPLLML